MPAVAYLSKSKLMSGAQCAKRLWLEINSPELAEVSDDTQRAFQRGHQVGAAARTLWPDGILIGHDRQLSEAIQETRAHLARSGPITLFEGTLRANGVLVRTDVLERAADGSTRLVEVKSSTSVKPHYIADCAIQLWVLMQAGIEAGRVDLGYINNQFIYRGDGDYRGLFAFENVTEAVRDWLPNVPRLVAALREALAGTEPKIAVGPQCQDPYECPFLGYCAPVQTQYPVTALPGGAKVQGPLLRQGIEDIREIPAGMLSNAVAEWVRRVTVAGEAELRPEAAEDLQALAWPRYYFDFETVSFAVPVWPDTRPYQPLPFQWSCHIEHDDGTLEHREFLAEGTGAPMRECAETLIAALGERGPILMYTSYENVVLSGLALRFPDLAPALQGIIERLVDLHPITRRNYYHPDMLGSWSLKKVLPTVAPDLSYDGLEHVSVGSEAEAAFQELLNAGTSAERRRELRRALLDYCRLDTLAMVRLAHALAGASAGAPTR